MVQEALGRALEHGHAGRASVRLRYGADHVELEVGDDGRVRAAAARHPRARRLQPDVVLMDIRMPELDGIEATRRVVAAGGDDPPRVLMLTTFDLNEYVYEALRAGASGFLLKDVPPEELAAGIRVVAPATEPPRARTRGSAGG